MIETIVDGYNLLHQSPTMQTGKGPQWLHRQRVRLIEYLASLLSPELCQRVTVVFDVHSPPSQWTRDCTIAQIRLRFAHGYPEADDLVEEMIDLHRNPSGLCVVSSDGRLQKAARRRHAKWIESRRWLDELLEQAHHNPQSGHSQLPSEAAKDQLLSPEEVQAWLNQLYPQERHLAEQDMRRNQRRGHR